MSNLRWVWDLDCTCIDSAHRDHLITADDWTEFHSFENLVRDVPSAWVLELDLWRDGKFRYGDYMYLTARDEGCRLGTETCLVKHGMWAPNTNLVMKDTPRHGLYGHESTWHYKPRVLLTMAHANPDTEFVFTDDDEDILNVMAAIDHPRIHVVDALAAPQVDVLSLVARLKIDPAW